MGRYEDLLAKARDGDTSALDDLEKEFSGSALREKAKEADTLREQAAANRDLALEGKLGRLRGQLPEVLRDMDLSVDDLGDVSPEDLTVEFLTEKAQSKANAVVSQKEELAKASGFDSVEELQEALDAGKQAKAKKASDMEKIASAASGGGAPVGDEGDPEPFDAMKADFEEAKKEGLADDYAMGEGIHSLMAAQAPVPIED